jgi:hypothetical protein
MGNLGRLLCDLGPPSPRLLSIGPILWGPSRNFRLAERLHGDLPATGGLGPAKLATFCAAVLSATVRLSGCPVHSPHCNPMVRKPWIGRHAKRVSKGGPLTSPAALVGESGALRALGVGGAGGGPRAPPEGDET